MGAASSSDWKHRLRETALKAKAKVVRAVRGNDLKSGPGMGIEWVDPSPALRDALTAFLSGG